MDHGTLEFWNSEILSLYILLLIGWAGTSDSRVQWIAMKSEKKLCTGIGFGGGV